MAIRKTRDIWEIQVDYGHGHGWEAETWELSRKEAIAQKKCYLENIAYPVRIKKKRERIQATNQ